MKVYLINTYHREKERKIKDYVEVLEALGAEVDVVLEEELHRIDGPSIVSGSRKMVGRGEVSKELLEFIVNSRYPVLGICYGHQAIAKAFGWEVVRCKKPHRGDEKIKKLREHFLFRELGEEFVMRESHLECVKKTNQKFEIIAVSFHKEDDEIIEGIVHRDRPIFGVQFHPERSDEPGKKLLMNFLKT